MKLQEFALRQKLSNNALYKAIRREGYTAKDLTDKRGNITSAGLKILRRMYPEDTEEQQQEPEQEPEQRKEAGREELEKEAESLRKQLAETKERAEKWEKLYLDLQDNAAQERAELEQQIKNSQILLARQQEMNNRLLMNPIKRLFSGRKKSQEID